MLNRFVGGVLLVIGTTIGGSILALPMVTAAGGFPHAALLLLATWMVMSIGAFLLLEVALWLPEGSNLISMAYATLGKPGRFCTWLVYLLLLYALLSAFIAGGGDLVGNLLALLNLNPPEWVDTLLFTVLFGAVVADGIRSVDWANRGLMSVKLGAFILLVALVMPHTRANHLIIGQWHALVPAIFPVVTSFGFAIVMPSLRSYFKSNVKALRLAMLIGSLVPVICYLLWIYVVQGSIATHGKSGLIAMAAGNNAVSDLTTALSLRLGSHWISSLAHIFTTICITTSFLAVSLCLKDFLTDGLCLKPGIKNKSFILLLTFVPPLLMVLFYPGIFIQALSYAGILCVVLLMLLPALMAWSGRYVYQLADGYQVSGGKWIILLEIVVACALLSYGIIELFI